MAASKAESTASAKTPLTSCIPDWVKAETFEKVLSEHEHKFKKILKFNAERAVAAGENYMTTLLKLEISLELEDGKVADKMLILKIPTGSALMQGLMQKFNVFTVEHMAYTTIIPAVEQLYREAGLEVCFGPKHYNFQTPDGSPSLLLENLCARGFKNTKRQDGLDEQHTRFVLKKLAQWHAGTATRMATHGVFQIASMFDNMTKEALEEAFGSFNETIKKCVPTYKGSELFADKVLHLQTKYSDEFIHSYKLHPNEFNVLNHGDCWSNNIMFQYDADGKISECYFVDFQILNNGSPTKDLQYFIISSTKLENKIAKFDYFVKYYHDELVAHLRLLKYPKNVPTLKELHMSIIKYGFWSYVTAMGVMGAVLADPTENANMDNFLGSDAAGMDFKMMLFGNARYRKHIEEILPWLYYRGALDTADD